MRLIAGWGRGSAALVWLVVPLALVVLAGCTGRPTGVQAVRDFQLERYLGLWYEVARLDHGFERGLVDVTAEYRLTDDGRVSVVNRGLRPESCRWESVEGEARLQGAADTGSLSVTFFWPFAGGYHIIALDQDAYAWAMVAGPTRGFLWILAREPDLDPAVQQQLVAQAETLGFDTRELIRVEHGVSGCPAASVLP